MKFRWSCFLFLTAIPFVSHAQVFAPVEVATNTTIRVMAANLTSGNNQQYEGPGLRIMEGLKPDVVAIQEFNSSGSIRQMVDATFGTNFNFYRETGSYSIPNGVISRYPMIESGSWIDSDPNINDRGFAWARIDLPGTNDLYVVSVHLKASSGGTNPSRRNAQATEIKSLIAANFPANAWIVVAGDFNIHSSGEAALSTFKTFLSDSPIPTDGFTGASTSMNTSANRSERYDYVLPSFSLNSNRTATVIGSKTFPNGLVFDSRVYTPLPSPVISTDSGAPSMQHMAVVKDFRIDYTVTNYVAVTSPRLALLSDNLLGWDGQSNVTYTVQTSSNLTVWSTAGTVSSSSSNFVFNIPIGGPHRSFYRVKYP